MKILLDYDYSTGNISDPRGGVTIFSFCGLEGCAHVPEAEAAPLSVKELVELKEAGFTSEEIIAMHKKGVA